MSMRRLRLAVKGKVVVTKNRVKRERGRVKKMTKRIFFQPRRILA